MEGALETWRSRLPQLGAPIVGARAVLALALALLAERELRGEDVPGANDNASGTAGVAELAAEVAAERLVSTRLVLLITGAEEAGTLGAEAFLRERATSDWLFLNFDGVAAPATLRHLGREGVVRTLTISAQDGTIPNYHRPSDVAANIDLDVLERALEVGRALIAASDRGEADG